MTPSRPLAALTALVVLLAAACGSSTDTAAESAADTVAVTATTDTATTDTATTDTGASTQVDSGRQGGRGPGGMSVESVSTVDDLVALVQEAYGDPGLGLHRGHQDIESLLIDVLGISHDEMHVRMEEQGQNLAAVAADLGVDVETLITTLVDSRMVAVDALAAAGTIADTDADAWRTALTDAYTFRINWNGSDATPTFTGI